MDRHRGDRYGGNNHYNGNNNSSSGGSNYNQDSYHNRRPSRFSDGPSRFSDGPLDRYSDNGTNSNNNYNRRSSPNNYRAGGHRPFESPPRHIPIAGGDGGGGGLRPMGGSGGSGGFRPMSGGGGGFGSDYQAPPLQPQLPPPPLSGQKRGFPYAGRGSSPGKLI